MVSHYILIAVFTYVTVINVSFEQSAPVFENLPNSITVDERSQLNQQLLTITIDSSTAGSGPMALTCVPEQSSVDACNVFQFTALQVTNQRWYGGLILKKSLDAIATPTYTLYLAASNGWSTFQTLVINVNQTRNRPPKFIEPVNAEIGERQTASSAQIIQYHAQSSDQLTQNLVINYRIVNGNFSSYFVLDPVLGKLTNAQPLLSSNPIFLNGPAVLQIEAAYVINGTPLWGDPSSSSIVNSSIYFIDNNANAPTFDQANYKGTIKETAPSDTFVENLFVTVTDNDRTPSSSTFDITLDNYNNIFKITPNSGFQHVESRISIITSSYFNYNAGPRWYVFNVIARESASVDRKSSQASVNISLQQVDRFAPEFTMNPYYATIPENASAGTLVVQIQAWDRDVGIFGNESLKYRLSIGAGDLFKMFDNGTIVVNNCRRPGVYPCLDYERPDMRNIRLIVFAMDLMGEGFTSTATVILNVTNVNDNPPVFLSDAYFGSIDDNSTILTLTPSSLNATDADGDKIKYSIESNNYLNSWNINPDTGVLTPTRPITYVNAPSDGSFYLVVGASDGDITHFAVVNVTIKVNPVNRYPPVFTQKLYNVSVMETAPNSQPIVEIKATDKDPPSTDGGKVSYRIVTGAKDFFELLNPLNGMITLSPNAKLDYKTNPNFTLTVEATDFGSPPKLDTATVQIFVIPSRPYVNIPDYSLVILDNEPLSKVIATVVPDYKYVANPSFNFFLIEPISAFDRNNNPLTINNTDKVMFIIDKVQGNIFVNAPLNASRIPIWQATITVQQVFQSGDTNIPLTDSSSLTVVMYPANKNPPVFNAPWSPALPFYNMTVPQGNLTQQVAGNFPASSLNQSLTIMYRLDDVNKFFELQSPYSGIIKQVKPIMEPTGGLTLFLVAMDNGMPSLTSTATINVIVDAVNLYPPVFSNLTYSASVYEDAKVGASVIQVTATDMDQGDFGKITYKLESSSDSNFIINPNDGTITVAKEGQFDALKNPKLSLEVGAYDSPNNPLKSRFALCYVDITVIDVNNHIPQFTQAYYQSYINDDLPVQSTIIQVLAIDGDLGENARVTYNIIDGNKDGYFSINPNNGSIILVQSLKSKSGGYTLTVNATDNGTPIRLSSSSLVYIFVSLACRTQCSPSWIKPTNLYDSVNVSETLPNATIIYTMSATPYAPGSGPLNYFFIDERSNTLSNSSSPFIILQNNSAASIYLNGKLNYDMQNFYLLSLGVEDSKVSNSRVTRYLNVFVMPVYTRNPQFNFDMNNCTKPIKETVVVTNAAGNFLVYKFNAKPNHKDDIVIYSLDQPNDLINSVFQLNNTTGELSIRNGNSIAAVTGKSYNLTVRAQYTNDFIQKDYMCNGNGSDQSRVNASITLILPPPVSFTSNVINFCIPLSAEKGSIVARVRSYITDQSHIEDAIFMADNSTKNNDLNITTNGDLILLNNPASILGISQMNVISYYNQTPDSKTQLLLKGYVVNQTTDLILITLNKHVEDFEVKGYSKVLISQLSNYSNNGHVCLAGTDPHTLDSGGFNNEWMDVYLYLIDAASNRPVPPLELDKKFNTVDARKEANIIGITGANTRWNGFNWNPVAIAIGLVMGLLLLALLFFCCCCLWIYIKKCCVKSVEKEPFIARAESTGMVNRAWASQQQLQEQQQLHLDVPDMEGDTLNKTIALHGQYDPDFVDYKSYAHARREDAATVDGGLSSIGVSQGAPSGYVHIEAPLSRSASALGGSDEVAGVVSAGGTAATLATGQHTTTETTVVKETYERGTPYTGVGGGGYINHEDASKSTMYAHPAKSPSRNEQTRSRAYGSRSVLNEIDDEPQRPVQLNETSNIRNVTGASQIGATLIRPETPGGQGYIQNIISGSDASFVEPQNSMALNEYTNYEGAFIQDPSRSNLAFQNEITMNEMGRPTSYYDEINGTIHSNIPLYSNDIGMTTINGNTGLRQETNYVEQIEETRFL